MEEQIMIKAAFEYAASRFGEQNGERGSKAEIQYACREGFYAGVEWQKKFSKQNTNGIEPLITAFNTSFVQRNGIILSPEDCKEFVEFLKRAQNQTEAL